MRERERERERVPVAQRMKGVLCALAGLCVVGLLAMVRLELNHQATRVELEHERQLREELREAMRTERQLREGMGRELSLLNDRLSDYIRQDAEPSDIDSHRQLQEAAAQGDADTCLNSDEVAYAAMVSTHTVSQRFREFTEQVLPGLQATAPGSERGTCLCSPCRNMTMPGMCHRCCSKRHRSA